MEMRWLWWWRENNRNVVAVVVVVVENNRNVVVEKKGGGRVSVGPCSVDVGSMYGRCGRGRKLKIKSKIKKGK